VPGVDGGVAEGEQQVRLAGSRGPDKAEIFGGADPLQGPEVVEGGSGHRGDCEVVLGEGLGDGESGLAASGACVGGVPGGDLGLDQGAEELLGVPPLRLGGDQQFGCEPAHGGHLQPFQAVVEVGGQRRWCRRHRLSSPMIL
jgi:hypothetical protein